MEMEHASFVPVPPARLARALSAQRIVAESMPGWQPDEPSEPGAPGSAGRLRLRVAGSTITYRGTLTVEGAASPFVVRAQGDEVRGTGSALLRFTVTLEPATTPEPGTDVTYRGAAEADGRLAANDGAVVEAALRRLLDRFSAQLGENAPEEAGEPGEADVPPAPVEPVDAADTADTAEEPGAAEEPEDAAPAEEAPAEELAPSEEPGAVEEPAAAAEEPDVVDDDGLSDAEDVADVEEIELVEVEVEVPESAAALDDLVSPAEAAHARRTMIGRSAEEVDHAPPRGRYAPEPAPDTTSTVATLRWAAPAVAALLASAVVVGRVLRRRR